jgi:hypothetical protein
MKNIIYIPIIKTGDAEIRGVEKLSEEVKDNITPVFELTRSRISKKQKEGDIYRRLSRLKEAYGTRRFILDLTDEPNLSNKQIEDLHGNHNGYENWISFMVALQDEFPRIIPTIQISDEGVKSIEGFYARIKKQLKSLDKYFDNIAYRFPLTYEHYKTDIKIFSEVVSENKIICIIDAGLIPQGKAGVYADKAISVINDLNQLSLHKISLSATSFPRNVAESGGEKYNEFNLEECLLYKKVNKTSAIIYGDYATINPTRSQLAGASGWVPRIDMPLRDVIFYHRSRKSEQELNYATAYTRVAKLVCKDSRYKEIKKIIDCWGIEQIELAAEGQPQGLSPSFWISVRMNIHMTIRDTLL